MKCNEFKCCICDEHYSNLHIPRNLRCGHAVCSICLDLLVRQDKRCPECRQRFEAKTSSDLPSNYSLLTLARIFTFFNVEVDSIRVSISSLSIPSTESPSDAGKCPSHGNSMIFMCMRCQVWICRDCMQSEHPDPPGGCCLILSSTEAMKSLKRSHSAHADDCIARAKDFKEKLKFHYVIKNIQESLEGTSEATWNQGNLQRPYEEISSNLATLDDLMKRVEKSKEEILNIGTPKDLTDSIQAAAELNEAIEIYIAGENDNSFSEYMGNTQWVKKKLKELLVKRSPVFVVVVEDDNIRWAPLKAKEGLLYIYSLRDGLPPRDGGHYLPYDFVQRFVPKESQKIFLEVGWRGEVKGEVHVGLFGDTPRSRQTLFLCLGEKGPSYRNTIFIRSDTVQDNCRLIGGGDYENNDGTGGRAIVDGIVSGYPYTHPVTAGLFVSWPDIDTWRLGTFEIYLDDSPGYFDNSAHGMVERGLDILREAAKVTPVTDASVRECGVVVPL